MHVTVEKMRRVYAEAISRWDFGSGYELFNIDGDPEIIDDFMSGHYYVLLMNQEIFGFFCDGEDARVDDEDYNYDMSNLELIDIGMGLNPKYIGRGFGITLLSVIECFYNNWINIGDMIHLNDFSEVYETYLKSEDYRYRVFRVTTAEINERAVRKFRQFGYQTVDSFSIDDVTGTYYFILMEKDISTFRPMLIN